MDLEGLERSLRLRQTSVPPPPARPALRRLSWSGGDSSWSATFLGRASNSLQGQGQARRGLATPAYKGPLHRRGQPARFPRYRTYAVGSSPKIREDPASFACSNERQAFPVHGALPRSFEPFGIRTVGELGSPARKGKGGPVRQEKAKDVMIYVSEPGAPAGALRPDRSLGGAWCGRRQRE